MVTIVVVQLPASGLGSYVGVEGVHRHLLCALYPLHGIALASRGMRYQRPRTACSVLAGGYEVQVRYIRMATVALDVYRTRHAYSCWQAFNSRSSLKRSTEAMAGDHHLWSWSELLFLILCRKLQNRVTVLPNLLGCLPEAVDGRWMSSDRHPSFLQRQHDDISRKAMDVFARCRTSSISNFGPDSHVLPDQMQSFGTSTEKQWGSHNRRVSGKARCIPARFVQESFS